MPPLLVILTLLGLTVYAAVRWPAWGFLGGWFFLILAPTSSVLPIVDLAFEHRMYLSLAAVIAAVVIGGNLLLGGLLRRLKVPQPRRAVMHAMIAVALVARRRWHWARGPGSATRITAGEMSIWADTVRQRPLNARAHSNLGNALFRPRRG